MRHNSPVARTEQTPAAPIVALVAKARPAERAAETRSPGELLHTVAAEPRASSQPASEPTPDLLTSIAKPKAEVPRPSIPKGGASPADPPIALSTQPAAAQSTAADRAIVPTPGNERALVQQVAAAIAPARSGDRIELVLDPPELGRVEIVIDVADQVLKATLSADRQSTADLIRRHIDMLGDQLRDEGFSDVDLSFTEHHEVPFAGIRAIDLRRRHRIRR